MQKVHQGEKITIKASTSTKAEAIKAIEEAIHVYNTRRLHEKLGFKTPKAFREEAMRKAA